MTNTGQIIAALAGGALLAICTMLLFKVRSYERRVEQRRRVDMAVAAILAGVETIRHDWPPDDEDAPEAGIGATDEARARAHLRLVATQPATKPGGRRDSLAPARASVRARARRLRSRGR
ncbi:hypothetical protein [Streptomyces sp. NPDC016626]|uniref:hypothetical protein n=1 Tax=Streptomyces sp. NPDC016626 TaxID=3364968 RepID=UPI0036FFF90B